MAKDLEPEFTERIDFRFEDLFDPEDPLAQFVMNLARGANDLLLGNRRLSSDFAAPLREEFTPPGHDVIYDIKTVASDAWELAKFIEDSRNSAKVAPFIANRLPAQARQDLEDALAAFEPSESDSPETKTFTNKLISARDQNSHYSELNAKLLRRALRNMNTDDTSRSGKTGMGARCRAFSPQMRAPLKLFLACLIAGAILVPASADAVVLSGGGSGPQGVPTCAGCGGSASGPVEWFDVKNTGGADQNNIPYNTAELDQIRNEFGAGKANTGELFRRAGWAFLGVCGSAFSQQILLPDPQFLTNNSKCPVWWNTKTTAPASNTDWTQIHSYWPDKVLDPTEGTGAAFNFKVFRENRRTGELQLIFARQLGVNGVPSENGDYSNYNRYWWDGGNTDNPAGDNGLGGRFTVRGVTSAGPIGSYEGNDRQNCISNWQRGTNGTLNLKGEPGGAVSQNVRPTNAANLDANFCYWEGDDIGPMAFRWSKDEPQDLIDQRDNSNFLKGASREVLDQQFGPSVPTQNYGVTTAGLKEGIYVAWQLPQGNGKPQIRWKIEGAPGLFYAVQVSLVDGREQLLAFPPSQDQTNSGYLYLKRQIFSATLVNPGPVNPPKVNPTCKADRDEIVKDHGAWSESQIEAQLEKDGYSAEDDPGCFTSSPPPTPTPQDFQGNPPDVDVELDADTPAQTRQHTDQRINVNVFDYGETQAVFPYLSNLFHYTPQQRFSSPGAAAASTDGQFTSYDDNYIHYDDFPSSSLVSKIPADVPPAPSGDQAPFNAQEAQLSRGLELVRNSDGSFSNGAGPLTSVDYGMTWLQPTLLSPCKSDPVNYATARARNYQWPTDPQSCPSDPQTGQPTVLNAWDDLLMAKAWWEQRWENGVLSTASSPDLIGTVYQENLRCATPLTNSSGDPNGGQDVRDCQNPSYGIFATVSNTTSQHAQGYLDVTGQAGAPGYAYISLRTNRPDRVTSATVTNRDAGTGPQPNYMQGAGPSGLINTVTGYVEQSYCYQGLPGPDTSHYAAGSVGSKVKLQLKNGTIETLDSPSGDPSCRGYDARWYWPQPGDSDYESSCNALPNKNPPVKPTGQSWPGVPVDPEGYSGYSGYYNSSDGDARTGTATDYDGDTFIGSPYVGKRPGKSTIDGNQVENFQLCTKLVPARYTDGYWSRAFNFVPVPGNSNTCQYHYNELYNDNGNLRAKFDAPNSYSESNYGNGYGSKCGSTWPNGSHRWRFGVYYPVNADWHWDPNSWQLGVPNNDTGKKMTPIGPGQPQRNLGKYWDHAPTNGAMDSNGWDGVNTITITTGNHNHGTEDIDQYFADSVWVKMVPKDGYLTSGHWVLNQGPQEGWGLNNSGFRLDASGYLADYTFSWPDSSTAASELAATGKTPTSYKYPQPGQICPLFDATDTSDDPGTANALVLQNGINPGTCWSMQADYEGYSNRRWRYARGTNNAWEDSAYVTIFGPRDSR